MVGLFVTSLVGIYTVEDLWDKFGDLKMSWVSRQFVEVLMESEYRVSAIKRGIGAHGLHVLLFSLFWFTWRLSRSTS